MTWKPMLAGALALGLSPPALAAKADLMVDNTFDGEAHVYVDGQYALTIGGDQRATIRVHPGLRELEVIRPGGFPLHRSRVMANRGITTEVRVVAPLVDLRVSNPSPAPLRVDLGQHDGLWLAPGTSMVLPVRAGSHELVSVVRERQGDRVVERRSLWLEPGAAAVLRLDYTPPPSLSELVILNTHGRDLRVLVGGQDRGALRRGGSLRLPLHPGRIDVQLVEVGGSVVFSDRVLLAPGADTRLLVEGRRAVRLVSVPTPAVRPRAPGQSGQPRGPRPAHSRWGDDDRDERDDRHEHRERDLGFDRDTCRG